MVIEGNFVGARGTQFSNSEYCSCQSTKINFYVLSKTKFALGEFFAVNLYIGFFETLFFVSRTKSSSQNGTGDT